jgi:hypothetical protein
MARRVTIIRLWMACGLMGLAGAASADPPGIIWDPPPRHDRGHGGFAGPFWWGDNETVVIEREVVREVPVAAPAPAAPPPPRKPYVLGASYDSLPPGGCMKLIEGTAAYYHCGGEWYREVRAGNVAMYKAVAAPL